jgi:uncharacterized membrane protein
MVKRLEQQVSASELHHSGEIRIYVEASLPLSYLWHKASMRHITRQRALTMFGKLRVWDTAHNNGVLIYLMLAERAIEVVADRGLNERVDPQVWRAMVSGMSAAFKDGRFEQGLTNALEQVSALLVQHFPLAAGDANPNELPDAPVLV